MLIKHTFFLDQGETLGGAERFMIDFLKTLNKSDYKRLHPILVGGKIEKYKNNLQNEEENINFNFPSVRGNYVRKCIACFNIFFAARRLKKLAKSQHAIRFFSNTPRTHFVMLLAKKFFNIQGLWVAYFHDFTTRPKFLLQCICNSSDFLLVNSLPTRKYLRDRINVSNFKKIKIVENGLDFSRIPEAQPSKKIEKILCLGRIDPRKGQKFLVEVANILQKENLHFFIVGDSFSLDKKTVQYEQEIKNLAQKNNLKNIHFLSAVEEPFDVILESDMMVVLSTESETFGRVVIEGLACGKLVLAFDITGPREILKSFESFVQNTNETKTLKTLPILRIKKQNSETLAKKIQFFQKHPEIVKEYTVHARNFVEQHFSLIDTKKRLLNVLLEQY